MTEYRTGIVLPMWAWGIILAVFLGLPTYSYSRLQSQVDSIESSLGLISTSNISDLASLRTEIAVLRIQVSTLQSQLALRPP